LIHFYKRHGHLRPPVKLQTLRHPGIKPFLTNNLSANNGTKMVNLKDSTVFDYIRYVGSAALLLFSTVVTFYAILEQKTSFWKAVPGWAALIIFLLVLFLLGVMEGIQIALVELKRQDPETYKESHPQAYRLGQVAARGDNIERFLMGRQVFVVCLVFFAAKLTTIHGRNPDGFLFPVPEVVQVGNSQDANSTLLRPCCWRLACWPASLSSLWPS